VNRILTLFALAWLSVSVHGVTRSNLVAGDIIVAGDVAIAATVASGGGTTYASDGSQADVQSKVNSAAAGDTVTIPAGAFNWTSTVTITNGVKLRGAGAGGFIGHSRDSETIGTGSFTFDTVARGYLGFTNGATIYALYTSDDSNYMLGTVTSSTSSNVTLNITSTGGSGTWKSWTFLYPPTTTISNSTANNVSLSLANTGTAYIQVSGIHFTKGSAAAGDSTRHITIDGNGAGGATAIVYDSRFSGDMDHTRIRAVNGLWFRNSHDCGLYSGLGDNSDGTEALQFKGEGETWSWTAGTNSMGMLDSTGRTNFYVEDCYFAGHAVKVIDFDDHARTVVRHCIFDQSGMVSHGPDSSDYGARHFEIYGNTFLCSPAGGIDQDRNTYNINWWLWIRGGSGVIASNAIDQLTGTSWWGSRRSFRMMCENYGRNAGPYACTTNYPSPHMPGWGYNGTGNQLDPIYIWGNTGTAPEASPYVTVENYSGDNMCASPVLSTDNILENREYYLSAKSGWTPFTYPHPLRP